MLNAWKKLVYWIPALLWMLLIFIASTDVASSRNTSRFLGPLFQRFIPDITPEQLHQIQVAIRKIGHLTEYAILALQVWLALRFSTRNADATQPAWKAPFLAFVIASLYAVSDEWHQSFVPSRQGSIGDVAIDMAGAALAMIFAWAWATWRQRSNP